MNKRIRNIRYWLLLGILGWFQTAHAVGSCSQLQNLVTNPSIPATLLLRSNYAANEPVASFIVSADFTCSGATGDGVQFTAPTDIGSYEPIGSTGLSWAPSGNTTYGNGYGAISVSTQSGGSCTTSIKNNRKLLLLFSGANVTCSGKVSVGITLYATTSSPSGTVPANLPTTGGAQYQAGWINSQKCNVVPACNNATADRTLVGTAMTIASLPVTCTLTAPSLTIVLPTVSNSASVWPAVGTVVGRTSATAGAVCSGNSSVGMSLVLRFQAQNDANGSGAGALLANTGSASGIAISFFDSSGNVLTSGAPLRITNSISNGATYSVPLFAGYVQTAASVGSGSVSGTATYFIEYY